MANSELLQNLEEQMASLEYLPKIQEKSEQIKRDLEREIDLKFFAVMKQIEVLVTTGRITEKQADQSRQELEQARLKFEGKTIEDRFLEWAIDRKAAKFTVEKTNYKHETTIRNELGLYFESVIPLPDGKYLAFGNNHIYKCKGNTREEVKYLEERAPRLFQTASDEIFAVGYRSITKIGNEEDDFEDQIWNLEKIGQNDEFYVSSAYLKSAKEMIVGCGDGSVFRIDLSDPNKPSQPINKTEDDYSLNPITAIDCFENTIFVGEGQSSYVGQGQDMKTIKAYHQVEGKIEVEDIFALNSEISVIQAVSQDELIIGTRQGTIMRIYKNDFAWNSRIIGVGLRVYDLQVLPDGRIISAHASEGISHGKIMAWKFNGKNWEDKILIEVRESAKKVKVFENGKIFVFSNSGQGQIYDGEVINEG